MAFEYFLISAFLRTDDAFILRFLRARKFDSVVAFKLLARYFEFRQNNPSIFKNFIASEPDIKASLYDGLPSVLPNCDQNGRRIIVLFAANWEIGRYQLNSIYRAILLTLEKLIDDEANQINGFVFIVDWSQFTFSQSRSLNPKVLKQMVEGLQVSLKLLNLIKVQNCNSLRFSPREVCLSSFVLSILKLFSIEYRKAFPEKENSTSFCLIKLWTGLF